MSHPPSAAPVALVTGASRGIGLGIARALAARGTDIALNALTEQRLEQAAQALGASSGRTVVPFPGDLTSAAVVDDVVAAVVERFGRLDILVNALGDGVSGLLVDMAAADVQRTLDLNVGSAVLCCRAAGPHLAAAGRGKVVNVASSVAVRGGDGRSVYTTAKAGVAALTRALALEWAPLGIQVNAVSPGYVPDATEPPDDALIERLVGRIPAGRVGTADEIGELVAFLVSPSADFITGQTVAIDGGMGL